MVILIRFFTLALMISTVGALATDHNEPELVSAFYSDRDGSGADVYGLFGYPTDDGSALNIILTLAPVPKSGTFDVNSVHRVFLVPAKTVELNADAFLSEFKNPNEGASLFRAITDLNPFDVLIKSPSRLTSFEKHIIKPIAENISKLMKLGLKGNNLPFGQSEFPEILARYSQDGTWAKIEFRNFLLGTGTETGTASVIAKSNGNETDSAKLKMYETHGIRTFVGGRDDPFFSDIAGFFRSINFAAALKPNEDFTWKGDISYREKRWAKELNGKRKRLLDRNPHHEGVYDAKDWREGNNINALVFQIPLDRLLVNRKDERLVYVWAEGYLTKEAYWHISKQPHLED